MSFLLVLCRNQVVHTHLDLRAALAFAPGSDGHLLLPRAAAAAAIATPSREDLRRDRRYRLPDVLP